MTGRLRSVAEAAGAAALLALVSLQVRDGTAGALETDVFRAINDIPTFAYPVVWGVMQLGNLLALPVVAVLAALTRRWRLAAGLGLATLGKLLLSRVVKDLVHRERPASVLEDVVRRDAPAAGQAFVSGHAAVAVALASLLHPYLGTRARVVAWTLAALVCLARIYVGAHLPLDVVGGALLGWAIASLIKALLGVPGGGPRTWSYKRRKRLLAR